MAGEAAVGAVSDTQTVTFPGKGSMTISILLGEGGEEILIVDDLNAEPRTVRPFWLPLVKDLRRRLRCSRIVFTTKRAPRAWSRMCGATLIGYVMEIT